MNIAIIDYGSGNLRSAAKAFERAGADAGIKAQINVTSNSADLDRATHIVLPGVGAYADCKRGLEALPGMIEALRRTVIENARPFLGICVGMQLMASVGFEHKRCEGLGWIGGEVRPLQPDNVNLKIPHMGWNDLKFSTDHPFLSGIAQDAHVYFVHGFGFVCDNAVDELAHVDYGGSIAAIIGRDNMIGTQFHPEKSQAVGLQLITNFLEWRP